MTPPPRYPQEQRQAIINAVLDGGCSVLEALRRAEAGGLPGHAKGFRMHKDAAYRAVAAARQERDQWSARTDPLHAIPHLARDLLAATVREGRRLEKAAKHGEYDADAIRAVTRNTQELHKLLRYTDPTSPEQVGKKEQPAQNPPSRPLSSLLHEEDKAQDQGQDSATNEAQATGHDTGHEPGLLKREHQRPATDPMPTP